MEAATKKEIATTSQQSESSEVMAMIIKAAGDSSDVAKMEKLMDLQERVLDRNAKQAFAGDFVRMKPHLKRVENTHLNTQTKSKYAKLEDINKEIDPVLEKFGFSTSTKIVNQNDLSVTVRAELWHSDGHIEATDITMPLDKTGIAGTVNKTGPHALTSSIKYARRVAICALLNISTGDGDDRDGVQTAEPKPISIEQAADIDNRARKLGDDYYTRFMVWAKVANATEIMDVNYKKVDAALSAAEKEKAKGAKQ